jgi:hypothetical protein
MGKLLIVGGILLIIGGIAGTMYGAFSGFSQFTSGIIDSTENAERFCTEGETLVTTEGASEYTPGQGYGRSVRYFCEDEQGSRREVTGEFVQGLFGQVGNIFGGMGSGFSFIIVSMIGVLLLIVGVLVVINRRLSARPQMMMPYNATPYYPPAAPSSPYDPAFTAPQPPAAPSAPVPQDLNSKLRALQEARDAGFISITEYEKARQHLVDEARKGN